VTIERCLQTILYAGGGTLGTFFNMHKHQYSKIFRNAYRMPLKGQSSEILILFFDIY
jgi:hypothetical protein